MGRIAWGERGRVAALNKTKTRQLYEFIVEQPGVLPMELAGRVGVTRPVVYWHMDWLERLGLIAHEPQGGRMRAFASDPITRVEPAPRQDDMGIG